MSTFLCAFQYCTSAKILAALDIHNIYQLAQSFQRKIDVFEGKAWIKFSADDFDFVEIRSFVFLHNLMSRSAKSRSDKYSAYNLSFVTYRSVVEFNFFEFEFFEYFCHAVVIGRAMGTITLFCNFFMSSRKSSC